MRWIALFALLIAMAAGLAWYGLQARWFTEPVWPYLHLAKSAVLVAIAALVTGLLGRLADGIACGQLGWQRRLRERAGAEPDEPLREVTWAHWALVSIIWIAIPLALLDQWGLGAVSEQAIERLLNSGIRIGDIHLVPGQMLLGAVVFFALVTLFRWLAHRLETTWLARTPLDASLRESVATLFGYAAFVIAVLVGLAIGGVDLTKFAIIAGALGVGIGFGLQNIVNNFVSGLILLFERPIRTGDFIEVNGTEGYVRKVRIRATEIETLNRQHVIVPNSDLLSNHVTNWMLRDTYGRITVGVGVAYGSDTALVQRLLLQAAEEHPLVLGGDQNLAPKPLVWFSNFGDSSLDFELKCHVRDVAKRYLIASELRFAIDQAFRAHDVTIPFPQRDIWFKNATGAETAPDSSPPNKQRASPEG